MSFRELAGHWRPVGLLSRSIARASLPPSLIFSGPEGVGKRRVALATAQAVNCLSPLRGMPDGVEFDACGTCGACRRIARGVHADVRFIVPGETGAIKIEQIRDAIDETMYRPFEGNRRVTVIDDADALVVQAQNALLKTLEEPPAASLFILITSRVDALLATVRSRCSQVRFSRLAVSEVVTVLVREHGYTDRGARAIAGLADGSVGRALETQADEFAQARASAEALLGQAAAGTDARSRLERVQDLGQDREQLAMRLRVLSSLLRDLGILSTGADTRLLANLDLRSRLEGLRKSFDSRRTLSAFTAVDRAQEALERNVSPKVVTDWLALQL